MVIDVYLAIQTHTMYMDQMRTQMDYHRRNLTALLQSLEESELAVQKAHTKLQVD